MLNPWLGVALVLIILLGLIIGLRQYQQRCSPHPEVVRKLLHVPMGLLTLSFPWLFDRPLPVVLLAVIAIAGLLALRLYPPLRDRLGSVLGGVGRRSIGEIYFPAAVAILFVLPHRDPLLFCIPMLILTLADAVAAIIGVRYGRLRYQTLEGQKSAEGSVTFFTIAFFSVHIPLLLLSDTGRAETLLIALIIGLLAMLLEAIAWHGLDNLFLPLGGYLLLRTHLEMDIFSLWTRLIVTLVLVMVALSWRRRTTLNDSAVLGAAFVGYLSWSIGGWRWLIPPLILFLSYPLLLNWNNLKKTDLTAMERQMMPWLPENFDIPTHNWERVHNIYAVLSVAAAGLLWLFLFGAIDSPESTYKHTEFFYPYTLAFAANLAIIGVAGLSPLNYWHSPHLIRVAAYIVKSWLLLFLPLLAIEGISIHSISGTAAGLIGTALAAIAYYLTQPLLQKRPTDTLNWLCRAAYTAIGSLFALIPLYVL
jgi:phytol kinase